MRRLLIIAVSLLVSMQAWAQADHETKIRWDADSTATDFGGRCDVRGGVIDRSEFANGNGSMRLDFDGTQGQRGCQGAGETRIADSWYDGDWVCYNWSMKIDEDFNWNLNQNKMKANRTKYADEGAVWTGYLRQDSVSLDGCPQCNECRGGGSYCSYVYYDFDPRTNPAVRSWSGYTIGIKKQSAKGVDDGQFVLWVDGQEVGRMRNQRYYNGDGAWIDANSLRAWMMSPYPQSPAGTMWLDDFEVTTGPSPCVAQTVVGGGLGDGSTPPPPPPSPDPDPVPDPGPDSGASVPPPPLPSGASGLAAAYPGDANIQSHPSVLFVEQFEDDLSTVLARWNDVNNAAGMSVVSDTPAGSDGSRSLEIRNVGGSDTGGNVFKRLSQNHDRLYLRYYIKYDADTPHHHSGGRLGGYNPVSNWPRGGAGTRPNGDDRVTIAVEPPGFTRRLDFYNYWNEMRCHSSGCWGNTFVNDDSVRVRANEWMSIEIMVEMNSPASASNGRLALWIDGELISHMGQGYPDGSWSGDRFTPGSGTPFEGFRWRTSEDLALNFVWLQNYVTTAADGETGRVRFDNVVVATEYIGPVTAGSEPAGLEPPVLLR